MDQLRFEDPVGPAAISYRDGSLMLIRSMGAHTLRLQVEVQTPKAAEAGQVLQLHGRLDAPWGNGTFALLGTAEATVAFKPDTVVRPDLYFTLTSSQLRALEEHRSGDLRLELETRAVLTQARSYPGCAPATLSIDVAESRWRQQLDGLGPTLGVELNVPFPADDEPRQEAVGYLREAQRRLRDNDVDGALLEARRALEYIGENSGWLMPSGKKLKTQFTQHERWAAVRKTLEDQASGALHKDAITKAFSYTRTEAETVIAMAAALLRLID
ncbi:hypothetical protein ABT083_30545 [Streptomyces goshikiensis]|uniref:hypothetical protein n=1 Tax=Streptomyces goshikiensis TaxID=1942 RepID=UPI003319709E